jgi:hypothetical protein
LAIRAGISIPRFNFARTEAMAHDARAVSRVSPHHGFAELVREAVLIQAGALLMAALAGRDSIFGAPAVAGATGPKANACRYPRKARRKCSGATQRALDCVLTA